LQAPQGGRFARLLEVEVIPRSAAVSTVPVDLLEINYRPSSWHTRVLIPNLKRTLVAGAMLGLLGGGFLVYRGLGQAQAQRRAEDCLDRSRQASQQQQWEEALQQAEAALAPAQQSGNPALLNQVHRLAGELAAHQSHWDSASQHYQALLDGGDSDVADRLTEARQKFHKQQRQAATAELARARKFIASQDYAAALKGTAAADQLYQENQGSAQQLAESHYLNGLVFERLGLPQDAVQHLRQAVAADPHHAKARRLIARLTAPTPRPQSSPLPAAPPSLRPEPEPVVLPRLDAGAGYPTYQKPVEEEEKTSGGDSASTRPVEERPRPNPGYPTYQKRSDDESSSRQRY
jgi:hypothetical protein